MGSIKHRKTSTVPNALNDTRRIGGDDWNNDHDIDLEVADVDGLEARLIPVDQVVQYRDDALAYRNQASGFADDAAQSATDAEDVVDSLAADDGATKVGTPEGTVQDALDGRVKQDALASPATVPAYDFTAAQAQRIFDNGLALDSYTELLAESSRARGVRITAPGIAGQFRYNAALPNTTNGGTRFAHASGVGAWERLFDGYASVLWFGAAGNGVTDDAVALEKAIDAGVPLDWLDRTYRVSRQVGVVGTVLAQIAWRSHGAKMVLDASAAHQQAVIFYGVAPGANHRIDGDGLTFDANSKANCGARFNQADNSRTGSFYARGLGGVNCRRNATFLGGEGVLIRGGFKRVDLIRPLARNIALPAGAGTPQVVGVRGIGVVRGGVGESYPAYTHIEDPVVDGVYSEDAAYNVDQDGIVVFGDNDAPGAGYSSFDILGGDYKDCWGRDIKAQTSYGTVKGGTFLHTTGPTGGIVNPLIDFQTGPGRVRDIDVTSNGVSLDSIVRHSSPTNGSWSDGSWTGGKLLLTGGATARTLTSNFPRQSTFGLFSAEDISVQGTIQYIAEVLTPDDKTVFVAKRISASSITTAGIRVIANGGAAPYFAQIVAEGCVNKGAMVPLIQQRVAGVLASANLTQTACSGFGPDSGRQDSVATSKSGLQMISGLVGNYPDGGTVKLYSQLVASGAEYEFPAHGYQNNAHIALVSMGQNQLTQGIVWVGSASAVSAVISSGVAVAASADPGTGTLRIWKGATGLRVKNADASGRVITVLFFG